MRTPSLIVVALALVVVSTHSRAQTPDTFFPKGTRDFAAYPSYATPILGDNERYTSFTATAGYYFADDHSINLGLVTHGIDTTLGPDAVAAEANLLFRWHFATFDQFTLFIDGGVGFIYADHNLPFEGDGTHWNFTPQWGVGATYHLRDNLHLIAGTRWFHASNAGLAGEGRHPGSNALMAYAGLMWTW
jgi:opacity protein-like surface antigen